MLKIVYLKLQNGYLSIKTEMVLYVVALTVSNCDG